MKKFIAIICMVLMSTGTALAGPHHHGGHHGHGGGWGHAPYYSGHHHHDHLATGLAVGLIGGTIISALTQPRVVRTSTYAPVYAPAITTVPAVVAAPVVVNPVVSGQTCYSNTNLVTGAVTSNCTTTTSPLVF